MESVFDIVSICCVLIIVIPPEWGFYSPLVHYSATGSEGTNNRLLFDFSQSDWEKKQIVEDGFHTALEFALQ